MINKAVVGYYLDYNGYKVCYDTIEQGHEEIDPDSWVSEVDRKLSLATGDLYILTCWPDTPVSHYEVAGSSAEIVFQKMNELLDNNE